MKNKLKHPDYKDYTDYEKYIKACEIYKDKINGMGVLQEIKRKCASCSNKASCPMLDLAYTSRSSLCVRMRLLCNFETVFSKKLLKETILHNKN